MRRLRLFRASARRGTTLVETAISIGIIGFIVSFVSFLVFMGAINAYNVHDQVTAQTSAAAASEQIASLLREASNFSLCPGDSVTSGATETAFTRIQFRVPPLETSMGTQRTSVIAWHPGNQDASPPVAPSVQYFENADEAKFSGTIPTGPPTRIYKNIETLSFVMESEFRLRIAVGYQYRGFAFVFHRPGNPQLGVFTTDVIAKNHFLPYGPNGYADNYDANVTTSVVHL